MPAGSDDEPGSGQDDMVRASSRTQWIEEYMDSKYYPRDMLFGTSFRIEDIYLQLDHGSHSGRWVDVDGYSRNCVIIFQLSHGLPPCANFSASSEMFLTPMLRMARWQFTGTVSPSSNYSQHLRDMLEMQARRLMAIQAAHEAYSPSPVGTGNFVDIIPGTGQYQVTVVSEPAFHTNKDEEDPLSESLRQWPDPLKQFSGVDKRRLSKFMPNTKILAFDSDGNWIHPSNYTLVFKPATWVVADVELMLWDRPPAYGDPKQLDIPPARRYELRLITIKALNQAEPIDFKYPEPSYRAPVITRASEYAKKNSVFIKKDIIGGSTPHPGNEADRDVNESDYTFFRRYPETDHTAVPGPCV
ncbi:hypothetical protein BD410DRAFT_805779 [Rickenella mellea]|uniref:Uncharacterized protein n=1 Tax=Rickenella mellea TaxID=50990 RepID=A0A4Y7PXU0_9AGAM|nr:hypothetical protein BD410DRAFT_805779 [Rickenella mellea]